MFNIFSAGTVSFWGCYRNDGLHLIHEIDDDEAGIRSLQEFIIPREDTEKLFGLISEKELIERGRKTGSSGLLAYLDAQGISYRRKFSDQGQDNG